MKKTGHTFEYKGVYYDRKVWLIKCRKTGGQFSTEVWIVKDYPQNVCPCCKEYIRREK